MNTALDDLLDTEQTRPPLYRGRHRARFLRQPVRLVLAAVLALVGIACGAGPATPDAPDAGSRPTWNAPDAPDAPAVKAPKAQPVTEFGDGDWPVGKKADEIPPGRYATKAPKSTVIACTWQRVKDFTGEPGAYVAAGLVEPGTAGRMVVSAKDGGVSLSGGCTWKRVK